MRLKSYFADTVEAAVSLAGKQLGPEAMLVYSREAPPEARHLGPYEVVFAVPPPAEPALTPEDGAVPAPRQTPASPAGSAPAVRGYERLAREMARLRQQVEWMATNLLRSDTLSWRAPGKPTPLGRLLDELLAAGIVPELLHETAARLGERPEFREMMSPAAEPAAIREMLRAELKQLFSVDSRLGSRSGGPRIVAFVGPPGSGKTMTLVKLAANYGLQTGRPAQLLSLDMYRIGAAEQLRSFAAILGVGFQALDTPAALAHALAEHRQKDLVLIDTPGHSEGDMDAGEELAILLRSQAEIDTHLTLSASMKSADLTRAVERFEKFRPSKLLFTKLDETSSPGTILNEAIRTGRPLSFLTNGQRIPEDVLTATEGGILDLVFNQEPVPEVPPLRVSSPPPESPLWKQAAAGQAAAA